jgi:diguanylate cyclase (GGDEF)-like protein
MRLKPVFPHRLPLHGKGAFLLIGLALIIAVATGDAALIDYMKQDAINDASRDAKNLAFVLAEQAGQKLDAANVLASQVADYFEEQRISSSTQLEEVAAAVSVTKSLQEKVSFLHHISNIKITSASGKLINRSRADLLSGSDLSDREYVKKALQSEPYALVVSDSVQARSWGEWELAFSKRISARDGTAIGVVSAVLNLGDLEQLVSNLTNGPNSTVALYRRDGKMLARHPRVPVEVGRIHSLMSDIRADVLRASVQGKEQIVASVPLLYFPAITVVVKASVDDVIAGRQNEIFAALVGGVLVCASLLILALLLANHSEQIARNRANAAVLKTTREAESAERKKLECLARHDSLTALPNRRFFYEELCRNVGPDKPGLAAVLYLDLDRFSTVNDRFGHSHGDQLLVQVAARLSACTGSETLLARLGGDEFAILLRVRSTRSEVSSLAKRLLRAFQEPFLLSHRNIVIGVSIGIAFFPDDASDPDEVVRKADLALYSVKKTGHGRFEFFSPLMEQSARARLELEQDLRDAITAGQFCLHFQPQVLLNTGEIVGFEALIRWNHPIKGVIGPDKFIPMAEKTGLIGPIGEWVIREGCRVASNWPAHLRLAVNVSATQFDSTDLVRVVLASLQKSGMSPDRLEIEVTESAMLNQSIHALPVLHELKQLGLTIAMDDFGTGYSSLSCLTLFPFDKLKIDKSFVITMRSREDCATIIQSTTMLAHNLRMVSVAEGVETVSDLLEARRLGCIQGQGYLFGAPMPEHEVTVFMANADFRYLVA